MSEASTGDPSGSRDASELAAALDSFADWARQEPGASREARLPPLRLTEGLEPGTVLGDYELVRRLGMGGMGVVFEARQRNVLGRPVAVKVLRNAFETEELSRRFRREVAAVAELDHPGIVPVVDARVDGGTPYYVMKFVEGVSAAALVRELKDGARVPAETRPARRFIEQGARGWIARIGLQVAEALQYAHEHGFVHRDVKPGNVLLTPRGRAVLVDFGLVAAVGEERLTLTGEFVGTLGYASPEQVRGEELDARSDVYSLGATLHELLALERPFGNCTHSELLQRLERGDPPRLGKHVPSDLRTIVSCALARTSARRYASAGALAADLRAFLSGQPIRARPAGWSEGILRAVRRHPLLFAAAAGVLVALGGLRGLAHHRAARLTRLSAEELKAALRNCRDVLEPGEITGLETELARLDGDQEYAGLLERDGWVSLTSEPVGARVTIRPEGSDEPLHEGSTPIERLELPEGNYVALLGADGRAPALLPFLVRRAACYEDPDARPGRALAIELLRTDELPDGFAYIPGGETLVENEPPRWAAVPSFLIQRHEVTWRELASWTAEREAWLGRSPLLPAGLPLQRQEGGGWEVALERVEPDWPVQGCQPMDMSAWADWRDGRIERAPTNWIPALPTVAEWVRAARGADGRPYPWGREFERTRCASYLSTPSIGRDARPVASGSFPEDVSPFGVFDLAGSVAEVTSDLHEPRPGEYAVCGGSYRSADPAELRVTALYEDENDRPRQEVGFRLVLRPLPEWALPCAGIPLPFSDDFERPDSPDVGGGWIELAGVPLGLRTNPNEPERCSIEGGRLVCRGGEGDFSESSSAWQAIRVSASGWRVRAEIRATCSRPGEAPGSGRRFGITLARGFRPSERELWSLHLGFDGVATLQWSAPGGEVGRDELGGFDPGAPSLFELHCSPARLEGRLWRAGGPRPELAELALYLTAGGAAPRFLGLEAPNLVGSRVEIERVDVTLE